MKSIPIRLIALALAGGMIMLFFTGCFGKKYHIDYDGQKDSYVGAKDAYRAGEEVELSYPWIATDTDYSFYLDGSYISPSYEDGRGYVIRFTMPEHDVKLSCQSKNSMVYQPPVLEDVMMVDYYHATVATVGGDGYDECVLTQTAEGEIRLDVYAKDEGSDATCVSYIVPYEALSRCQNAIEEYDFASWQYRDDTSGITGAVTVVKFRQDDGNYLRVTTEKMPQDGRQQLDAIGSIMREYILDEYKQ